MLAGSDCSHSLIGDLAYNDYVVLLCYMDAEWSMRRPLVESKSYLDLLLGRQEHFAAKCHKYRDGIEDNYKKFSQANGLEQGDAVSPYLFDPAFFIPFGHADDLAVVLLDDFDPVHYLTAETRTTLEEVCLAFSPKLDSFSQPGDGNICCELPDLFALKAPRPGGRIAEEKTTSQGIHSFQQELPLLAFTKYKAHGLTTVGPGLLFQRNLLGAMAAKVQSTVRLLRERMTASESVAALISEEDLDSVKCVFLDLQGPEELGTLVFCRNYSVATTLIASLRTLTFGDVLEQDPSRSLGESLRRSNAHRTIIGLQQRLRLERVSGDVDLLREMHVFRWTHTSLAVSPNAFYDPYQSKCNGFVEALSELQISPGHRCSVEEQIKAIAESCHADRMKTSAIDLSSKEYHRYEAGIADLVLPHGAISRVRPLPLVSLASVISFLQQCLCTFGYKQGHEDPGRHIIDTVTTLIVPVPRIIESTRSGNVDLIFGRIGNTHSSPLADLLPLLQKALCYPDELSDGEKKLLGPGAGQLSVARLKEACRSCGVPVSLRRTVEYLYQDFAILVADPFLFDAVLDLYDILATLYSLLTKHLPAVRAAELESAESDSLSYLDEGRVEQLSILVEAIHNALMHRVVKAYPEAPTRDMAIDFRGGLNQILLAADAPVKCGLGVLRKCALGADKDAHRDTVGGITRISFMPGARCRSFSFGLEDRVQLACFEADVAHVLHVDNFCDNLHECFHLVFNALCNKRIAHESICSIPSDSVMGDRVSEIFANLLSQMFLFGSDVRTFIAYHLCSYSKGVASLGWDDSETVARFTELLIRLFVVADAVPPQKEPREWEHTWTRQGEDVNDALGRFKKMTTEFGSFFSEYQRLWNGSKKDCVESYCWAQFSEIYPKVAHIMPDIWSEAVGVYERFARDELYNENGSFRYGDKDLSNAVQQGLRDGKPLVRAFRENMKSRTGDVSDRDPPMENGVGITPLVLVCSVLHEYTRCMLQTDGKAVHVFRRPDNRNVEFPKGLQSHVFQVDKGAAQLFCPVPDARRMRLKMQIAMLKTFWDISATLRERRLYEMISNAWPEARGQGAVSEPAT